MKLVQRDQPVIIESVARMVSPGKHQFLSLVTYATQREMSHEVQTDLRVGRTHKFLQEAMIELIAGGRVVTVRETTRRFFELKLPTMPRAEETPQG